MSQKFLKSYTGFSRKVLEEVMAPEDLKKLDKEYNRAKRIRMERRKVVKMTAERKLAIKELRKDLKVVLANDVCSAQALDVSWDRLRVEKEIAKFLTNNYTWQRITPVS